jgi:hypothetical protein
MSVGPESIFLTDAQRQALVQLSDKLGKPWPEVLSEALSSHHPRLGEGLAARESFSAAASRLGLIGCVEGPADPRTNPDYLQGLGQREP